MTTKFKDLSRNIKIGVIGGWVSLILFGLTFISGFLLMQKGGKIMRNRIVKKIGNSWFIKLDPSDIKDFNLKAFDTVNIEDILKNAKPKKKHEERKKKKK